MSMPTASETLIAAMEELGGAEDNQVMVIIRNSNGEFIKRSNVVHLSDRIGMLQTQLMWEQVDMITHTPRSL